MTGNILRNTTFRHGNRTACSAAYKALLQWFSALSAAYTREHREAIWDAGGGPIFVCAAGRGIYVYPRAGRTIPGAIFTADEAAPARPDSGQQ